MQKHIFIMGYGIMAIALLGLTVWFFPGKAEAQNDLVLYDDFGGPLIDPNLWAGGDTHNWWMCAENIRKIRGRKLILILRGYGNAD